MDVRTCEGTEAFTKAASRWCESRLRQHEARSLFLPAGQTPVPLFEYWERKRPEYLEGLRLVQIDDVLGGPRAGLFRDFFEKRLPTYRHQLSPLENVDEPADVALLGLGLNGHVGFHEPGLPPHFNAGCVKLSEPTCLHLDLDLGSWGITYGIGSFSRARAVLLLVRGAAKREVLQRLLAGDQGLPASALLSHPDLTILADTDALPSRAP